MRPDMSPLMTSPGAEPEMAEYGSARFVMLSSP